MYEGAYLIYATRPGYDYKKYLEDRSHYDHLANKIDTSISELAISERMTFSFSGGFIRSMDALTEVTSDGFATVDARLYEIIDAIDDLNVNLTTALQSIDAGIELIGKNLKDIAKILENPSKTWAEEQYVKSIECFNYGLFNESLEYAKKATFGHGSNTGDSSDWRYHFIIGMCFLGGDINSEFMDCGLVNISGAKESFVNVKRYARLDRQNSNDIEAAALSWLGWCAYCSADLEESIELYRESYRKVQTDDAAYGLTKSSFALGKPYLAETEFSESVWRNPHLLDRASTDPDFIKDKVGLKRLKSSLFDKRTNELFNFISQIMNDNAEISFKNVRSWSSENDSYFGKIDNLIIDSKSKMETFSGSDSVFDYKMNHSDFLASIRYLMSQVSVSWGSGTGYGKFYKSLVERQNSISSTKSLINKFGFLRNRGPSIAPNDEEKGKLVFLRAQEIDERIAFVKFYDRICTPCSDFEGLVRNKLGVKKKIENLLAGESGWALDSEFSAKIESILSSKPGMTLLMKMEINKLCSGSFDLFQDKFLAENVDYLKFIAESIDIIDSKEWRAVGEYRRGLAK